MFRRPTVSLIVCAAVLLPAAPASADDDAARLVAAMLEETPLVEDLRQLTDEIGGRATGSAANERSVAWALSRFEEAGVAARAEAFEMPEPWLETSAAAVIEGGGVRFAPRVAAMAFSAGTPEGGTIAQLKLNSAIAAAVVWGYTNAEIGWTRLDRARVQKIIDSGLGNHMMGFRVMQHWQNGSRGRTD